MSTVSTDTVKALGPNQDLTIGTTGQTVTLPGNDLRVNTVKDKGGNTLWTSDGAGNLSSVNSAFEGNLKLIQEQTAANSASISFTTGIDSTYDVYIFKFIDINPAAVAHFSFQGNASGQTGFNEVITSVYYKAYHDEGNSAYALALDTGPEQIKDPLIRHSVKIQVTMRIRLLLVNYIYMLHPQQLMQSIF